MVEKNITKDMMKALMEREIKKAMKMEKINMNMEKLLTEVTELMEVTRNWNMKPFSVKKKSGKILFG